MGKRAEIGDIREWAGGPVKKVDEGKWVRWSQTERHERRSAPSSSKPEAPKFSAAESENIRKIALWGAILEVHSSGGQGIRESREKPASVKWGLTLGKEMDAAKKALGWDPTTLPHEVAKRAFGIPEGPHRTKREAAGNPPLAHDAVKGKAIHDEIRRQTKAFVDEAGGGGAGAVAAGKLAAKWSAAKTPELPPAVVEPEIHPAVAKLRQPAEGKDQLVPHKMEHLLRVVTRMIGITETMSPMSLNQVLGHSDDAKGISEAINSIGVTRFAAELAKALPAMKAAYEEEARPREEAAMARLREQSARRNAAEEAWEARARAVGGLVQDLRPEGQYEDMPSEQNHRIIQEGQHWDWGTPEYRERFERERRARRAAWGREQGIARSRAARNRR